MPIYDILNVTSQKDASSLRQSLRLDNVSSGFASIYRLIVVPELAELQRNCPGFRKEVILLWKVLFHGH